MVFSNPNWPDISVEDQALRPSFSVYVSRNALDSANPSAGALILECAETGREIDYVFSSSELIYRPSVECPRAKWTGEATIASNLDFAGAYVTLVVKGERPLIRAYRVQPALTRISQIVQFGRR